MCLSPSLCGLSSGCGGPRSMLIRLSRTIIWQIGARSRRSGPQYHHVLILGCRPGPRTVVRPQRVNLRLPPVHPFRPAINSGKTFSTSPGTHLLIQEVVTGLKPSSHVSGSSHTPWYKMKLCTFDTSHQSRVSESLHMLLPQRRGIPVFTFN